MIGLQMDGGKVKLWLPGLLSPSDLQTYHIKQSISGHSRFEVMLI